MTSFGLAVLGSSLRSRSRRSLYYPRGQDRFNSIITRIVVGLGCLDFFKSKASSSVHTTYKIIHNGSHVSAILTLAETCETLTNWIFTQLCLVSEIKTCKLRQRFLTVERFSFAQIMDSLLCFCILEGFHLFSLYFFIKIRRTKERTRRK